MMPYVLMFVNIIFLLTGQFFWKQSVSKVTQWNMGTLLQVLLTPSFLAGAALYVVATMIWLYIISKIPFSVAYPMQSITYIGGMVIAYIVFKEHVSLTQWAGAAIIIFGVYLIAK